MRILVNCHQGRSRTKRSLQDVHKAPTKQFILYLKKAAETRGDDESNKHDFRGCGVAEFVQRWLQVLCGGDFTLKQVDHMLHHYHTKALKHTKLNEKLISYLTEGPLVSPAACELVRPCAASCFFGFSERASMRPRPQRRAHSDMVFLLIFLWFLCLDGSTTAGVRPPGCLGQ